MYGEPDKEPEVRILGFSIERLRHDTEQLRVQKENLSDVMAGAAAGTPLPETAGRHAYPLVARTDGGKIVEYNVSVTVPREWIVNPKTGETDVERMPERKFPTPLKEDGLAIDKKQFNKMVEVVGLHEPDEIGEEWRIHQAHLILSTAKVVAVTRELDILRNSNGLLLPGAEKYADNIPPLGVGHVPVPPPAAAPGSKFN